MLHFLFLMLLLIGSLMFPIAFIKVFFIDP